jgi:protein-tyrosine phosphatase
MLDTVEKELDASIPGAINLRDLGGIPVEGGRIRPGLVFRSGMMHNITPEGLRILADMHAVRTVVDLRNDMELDQDGVSDFTAAGITHRHVPVVTEAATAVTRTERIRELASGQLPWADMYLKMLRDSPGTFRQFFEVLADQRSLSVVFHCAGGRDRTGVTAMLLLSALGAEDDVIATDYARTGPILARYPERFERTIRETGLTLEQMAQMVGNTAPEVIHDLMAALRDEWGSTEGYLESTGLDMAVIPELRAQLVA